MRTFVKYAAVGFAGYLVGFYEMKYKTMKVLLEACTEAKKESNGSSEPAKEGEEKG